MTTDSELVARRIAITPTRSKLDQTRTAIATDANATGMTIPRALTRPGTDTETRRGSQPANAARTGAQYHRALYQSFCV